MAALPRLGPEGHLSLGAAWRLSWGSLLPQGWLASTAPAAATSAHQGQRVAQSLVRRPDLQAQPGRHPRRGQAQAQAAQLGQPRNPRNRKTTFLSEGPSAEASVHKMTNAKAEEWHGAAWSPTANNKTAVRTERENSSVGNICFG